MIAVLLPFAGVLIAAILLRFQYGTGRSWSVHVLAVSAALLVLALARAASSHGANQCALDLAPWAARAIAKVHR